MPTPIATITGLTATGDTITGPGFAKYIFKGMPVALVGDSVTGAACTGVISQTTALNRIYGGRPLAIVTSVVTGANPATGVPVSLPVAVSKVVNVLD